jgi:hypothetical protein
MKLNRLSWLIIAELLIIILFGGLSASHHPCQPGWTVQPPYSINRGAMYSCPPAVHDSPKGVYEQILYIAIAMFVVTAATVAAKLIVKKYSKTVK